MLPEFWGNEPPAPVSYMICRYAGNPGIAPPGHCELNMFNVIDGLVTAISVANFTKVGFIFLEIIVKRA